MKNLLLGLFLLAGFTAFAQGTVTGTLMDVESNLPLSGANVIVTNTVNGTVSDFDGNFVLKTDQNSGSLTVTFIGYARTTIPFTVVNGKAALGIINIDVDNNSLEQIVIVGSGVVDLAEGRSTPVAVSTIKAAEIQLKAAGNVEFTEAFAKTPSVYVANQVGGFGDSQVFLRGFDDTNTAFLLNGQPINGVEDGRMYWSNWSGMADVANAVQVQRGLGSSKLAISSVGGTVNIISKTTESREGGYVRFLTGNDSYFKGTASYNSGLNDKGWAFSVLLDHWQAHRKWSEGTEGQGQNYLFSVGYKASEKSVFNFLLTGAPQYHDQNFSRDLEDYAQFGDKYNPNSGFLNGERATERRNFYHKPVANLNWDYEFSDKLNLSTVLYASWGRGGGTGRLTSGGTTVRNEENGLIDFDAIVANNATVGAANNGLGSFGDAYILRSSVNAHNWYGTLANLDYEINENLNVSGGFDIRLYNGIHFRQLNNLFGLQGYNDNFGTDRPDDYVVSEVFEADPWDALFNRADDDQRVAYNYEENINYQGAFGQIEYATDKGSIFFQGAASNQSYQREGFFVGRSGDGLGESEKINKLGYNAKGGASWNITDKHAIFANAGYYSRQPFLDNVFADIRNSNALTDPEVENEEITGLEAGYRFQNNNFRLNVDVYHTTWGNRFISYGSRLEMEGQDDRFLTTRLTDVTQIHNGAEFDFEFRPAAGAWRITGYGSVGNWKYQGETPYTTQDNDTFEFLVADGNVNIDGVKVGNAPQTSFGAGFIWDATTKLSFDLDARVFENQRAFIDVEDLVEAAVNNEPFESEKVPSYGLMDAGATYRTKLGDNKLTLRGNLYNIFNRDYINQIGQFGTSLGVGRTFNVSAKYSF